MLAAFGQAALWLAHILFLLFVILSPICISSDCESGEKGLEASQPKGLEAVLPSWGLGGQKDWWDPDVQRGLRRGQYRRPAMGNVGVSRGDTQGAWKRPGVCPCLLPRGRTWSLQAPRPLHRAGPRPGKVWWKLSPGASAALLFTRSGLASDQIPHLFPSATTEFFEKMSCLAVIKRSETVP